MRASSPWSGRALPSWASGEDDRMNEWRGEGTVRLARKRPKPIQRGPSLPREVKTEPHEPLRLPGEPSTRPR